MTAAELQRELIRIAHTLRPVGKPLSSVVGIAYDLGTAVWLRFHTSRGSPTAQIDFANQPPKILLYRAGKINGEREIRPFEDDLLTARERFSIAHELGHWMAFTHFRLGPAPNARRYWEQEKAINAFAGCLLIPDWLVGAWLTKTPEGQPLPPSALEHWAKSQCGVSEEVVTKALVRRRKSIGFLRLWFSRNKGGTRVLEVLSSACGEGLQLPKRRAHIQDSPLLDLLKSSSGSAAFERLNIASTELYDANISWFRNSSKETTWVSISTLSGGLGLRPSECESCGLPVSTSTAVLDPWMPYSIFCCLQCRDEAAIAAGNHRELHSSMIPPVVAAFDDWD